MLFMEPDLKSLSSSDKRTYRIESGVKVTEVKEGRFKDIGMPKGYIITSVNGKKVNTPADVKSGYK